VYLIIYVFAFERQSNRNIVEASANGIVLNSWLYRLFSRFNSSGGGNPAAPIPPHVNNGSQEKKRKKGVQQ
jgi:hypothetical protein